MQAKGANKSANIRKEKLKRALKKAKSATGFATKDNQNIIDLLQEAKEEELRIESLENGELDEDSEEIDQATAKTISRSPSLFEILINADTTLILRLFFFQLCKILFMVLFALSAFVVVFELFKNIIPFAKYLFTNLV